MSVTISRDIKLRVLNSVVETMLPNPGPYRKWMVQSEYSAGMVAYRIGIRLMDQRTGKDWTFFATLGEDIFDPKADEAAVLRGVIDNCVQELVRKLAEECKGNVSDQTEGTNPEITGHPAHVRTGAAGGATVSAPEVFGYAAGHPAYYVGYDQSKSDFDPRVGFSD